MKPVTFLARTVLLTMIVILMLLPVAAIQAINDPPIRRSALFQTGGSIFGMSWSPDGSKIVAIERDGSGNKSVVVYNLASQQEAQEEQRITNFPADHILQGVSWSYDSTRVAIIIQQEFAIEPIIDVWNIIDNPATKTVSYVDSTTIPGAGSIVWRPGREQVAYNNGPVIRVIDLSTTPPTVFRELRDTQQRAAGQLDWDATGSRLVGGGTGKVFVWDVDNSLVLQAIDHPATLHALALNDDGTQVATGYENHVRTWDVSSGSILHILPGITADVFEAGSVTWSGDVLVANMATSESNILYVWNANTAELVGTFETSDIVYSIDVSPNGNWLAYSGDNDNNSLLEIIPMPVPGITVLPYTPQTIAEDSSLGFTLTLGTQPTAFVIIPMSVGDPDQCTVDVTDAVLTSANWSTGVVVTVSGIDDGVLDGDQPCNLVTGDPTSADSDYDALTANDSPDVNITITDSGSSERG